ncbi:MAG: rhodanese-like domain-containing protein [Pseudomonadota bacterium]
MKRIMLALAAGLLAVQPALSADTAGGEWDKLITAETLSTLDGATVLDIRAPGDFASGHIPGAVNIPYPSWRGPAENPGELISDSVLTELLQSAGLDHSDRVVVAHAGASTTDFGAAARVYWTLKSAGFPEIAILNGGTAGWVDSGKDLSTTAADVTPSAQTFSLSDRWSVDGQAVADIIAGKREGTLVDARPYDFFVGERQHQAATAPGTLRGAVNFPFASWFDGEDIYIKEEALAQNVAANIPAEAGEIVSFCNTGHWAATNWFALSELAGLEDVKLYPESVVGWINAGGETVIGQ